MKMKKFLAIGALAIFSIFVFPVFAASADFLSRATEYYQRRCTRNPDRISRSDSMLCYLFDKVQELDIGLSNQSDILSNLQNDVATNSAGIDSLKSRKSIIDIAQVRGAQFNTSSTTPVPTPDSVNITCDVACLLWVDFYVDTRNSSPSANPAGNYNLYGVFVDGVNQAVFTQASFPVPHVAIPLSLNGVFPVSSGAHTVQIYAWTNGGQLQSFESALQVLAIEE